MAQGKTVVPGMDDVTTVYSRGGNTKAQVNKMDPEQGNKTRVPGMGQPDIKEDKTIKQSSKPIVGFLFSISRTNYGEYWPLYLGANVIGRSSNCDIILKEATVSDQHAELVVRAMRKPEKLIASIRDSRSTCGSLVNEESLGFEPKECFNRDIITIGEHYELLLILIDTKQIGLALSQDFISTEDSVDQNLGDFPPVGIPFNQENRPFSNHDSSATIGMDGVPYEPSNGGTKIM